MQAEEALIRSEQRLQRAQQIAHVGSFEIAPDGSPTRWSDECFRIVGLDPESEIPSRRHFLKHIMHPDDRARSEQIVSRSLGDGTPFDHEFRLLHPDGSVRWVHSRGEPTSDRCGRSAFVGTLLDITQRKQAEAARQKNEKTLRLLVDSMHDCISLSDVNRNSLYVSPSYFRMTGYTVDEIAGVDFRNRVHPDDLFIVNRAREANLRGEATRIEWRCRHADGFYIWMETSANPIRNSDGQTETIACCTRDIAERWKAQDQVRELQEQLAHMGRIATMGEMATGLAHELNQPLAAERVCQLIAQMIET